MNGNKKRLNGLLAFKNFTYTYVESIKIAWKVKKQLFLWTTAVNIINGLMIYPRLLITKYFVDSILDAINTGDVLFGLRRVGLLMLLELGLDLTTRLMNRFDWVFSHVLSRYVAVEIELNIAHKLNSLPIESAENPQVRDKIRKILDRGSQSAWGLIMSVSDIPRSIVTLLSAGFALSFYNPILLVPAFIFAIPEVVVGAKNTKEGYKLDTKISSMWRIGNAYVDFLTKGRYLYENKILLNSEKLISQVWGIAKETFEERYHVWMKFAQRRFFASIPLDFTQVILKGYLYMQAILGRITLGTAQMQISAIGAFIGGVTDISRKVNEMHENYLYVKDYNDILGLEEENLSKGINARKSFTDGIEFKNVWFKYPQGNHWTLKGVSFSIDPKENIAIVGKNGAGKTTIIKLLCKFYEPQRGEILVNGKNIKDVSAYDLRKTISALFQDFAQYPFSAMVNISYGDVEKVQDLEKVKKSARLVGIEDFIERLPKGYKNPLDNEFEGGIEPSKGQWQRLALARALYRDAPMLILDEPTSNVDPQAEEDIFEKIIEVAKDKVVILVSHRFSTVRRADKILVLEKGKVLEYGNHRELIKNNKTYAKLFNLQAQAYMPEKQ